LYLFAGTEALFFYVSSLTNQETREGIEAEEE